jgi:ligand-binding SRPBCC domain-containing protein
MEILLRTTIEAPAQRCFDLARNVDFHAHSAASTEEEAVAGITEGLLNEGQEVTWRGKHLGLRWTLRVRITAFNPPGYFQDAMVSGPFHHFTHDHSFEATSSGTLMTDRISFSSPVPLIGDLLDRFLICGHLEKFVRERNLKIKTVAESDLWCHYLPPEDR